MPRSERGIQSIAAAPGIWTSATGEGLPDFRYALIDVITSSGRGVVVDWDPGVQNAGLGPANMQGSVWKRRVPFGASRVIDLGVVGSHILTVSDVAGGAFSFVLAVDDSPINESTSPGAGVMLPSVDSLGNLSSDQLGRVQVAADGYSTFLVSPAAGAGPFITQPAPGAPTAINTEITAGSTFVISAAGSLKTLRSYSLVFENFGAASMGSGAYVTMQSDHVPYVTLTHFAMNLAVAAASQSFDKAGIWWSTNGLHLVNNTGVTILVYGYVDYF